MTMHDESCPCTVRIDHKNDGSNMRTAGWLLGATMLVSSLALPATQAYAMSPDMFFHANPVSDGELGQMRGGFNVSGLHFNIGISFAATINGVAQIPFPTLTLNVGGTNPGFKDANGNSIADAAGKFGVINSVVNPNGGNPISNQTFTNTLTGVLNLVQNTANGATIQTISGLTIDVFNSGINAQTLIHSIPVGRFNDLLKFQSVLGNLH